MSRAVDEMMLGLAVLQAKKPRQSCSLVEIAAYAGCTRGGVWMIERRAIHKLQRRVFLHGDRTLKELFAETLQEGNR